MRKAGVDHSVIMKMTGHKTAAMFHRYNSVDLQDAQDDYQKLQEYLTQERHCRELKHRDKKVLP